MIRTTLSSPATILLCRVAAVGLLAMCAGAQSAITGPPGPTNFHSNYHLRFDRPEAWGLKYFASSTLLSGLELPEPHEGHRAGSVVLGFELDQLPALSAGQQRIGFNGTAPEDLNKAPVLARPVLKIGLPGQFSMLVAAPPPLRAFGVRAHLLAFGLERTLVGSERWVLGWRAYGQIGSIKGAFTCPHSVLRFPPGSAGNPTACVAESADVASLRYAGAQVQLQYRIPAMPKLVPHVAVGGNLIDGAFQVNAPVQGGLDRTHLWTRGGTLSATAGVSYSITRRASITVDAFYSPLSVRRNPAVSATNDGLLNIRALLTYAIR